MGGFGSGRRGSRGKDCTDDVRALDVRRMQRDGLLKPDSAFRWRWSRGGETTASIDICVQADAVRLDYRQRSRGGEWQDMAYRCQRESDADRSTRKADKLRERLQWQPGILNGDGGKPKGMHWKTYFRLYAAHNDAAEAMLRQYEVLTGRLQGRLEVIDAKGWR